MISPLQDATKRMWASGMVLAAQAGWGAVTGSLGPGVPVAVEFANGVLGMIGGLAGNLLATDLHAGLDRPVADPEARRWNHDILRAGALAISDIIKDVASDHNTATQESLTRLAGVVASYYDQVDDPLPMAVVTEEEIKTSLAKGEGFLEEEAGSASLWTAFLHHVINTDDDLPAIKQTLLEQVGREIARRFHRQLLEVLKFDFDASGSPLKGRAYASVTLRLLMKGAESNQKLLGLIQALQEVDAEGHRTTHQMLQVIAGRHDPVLAYCAELQRVFAVHENLGLPATSNPEEKDAPLAIRDLFVEPTCAEQAYSPDDFSRELAGGKNPAQPLLPLLGKHRRVVLLADPGMGKSTLVQWLISSLAAQALDPSLRTPFPEAIPLPFILRDLVSLLPVDHTRWDWPALLEAFKQYKPGLTASEALVTPLARDTVAWATLLRSANAFFLIDGLDEIGDPERRKALRRALWQGFGTHPGARFLVTSRIIGYEEAVVHEEKAGDELLTNGVVTKGFRSALRDQLLAQGVSPAEAEACEPSVAGAIRSTTVHATCLYLAPFDDAQQDQFARNWYRPRLGEVTGLERAAKFMEAVRRHASTQVIGRVPNLLYLLALLYRHKAHLPDGRAQVYAAISDAYLEGITVARQLQHQPGHSVPYTLREKEGFLATIAMHMQIRRAELVRSGERNLPGEVLATSLELRAWLAPSFRGANTPEDCAAVDDFISYVARRAGLLLPRGEGVFAFAHLSFQEYYASRYLKAEVSRLIVSRDETEAAADAPVRGTWEKFIHWSRESAWREVFTFLVESLKEDEHITWAFIEKVFLADAALEEAEWTGQDGPACRCLPLSAAQLLAGLSVNYEVALSLPQRQTLWGSLWQTYLRWPVNLIQDHPWPVAPLLTQSTPYQRAVLRSLVEGAGTGMYLNLKECSGLADVSFLAELPQLTKLDLSGCAGVTELEPLRGLPLEQLDLRGCAGVTELEPLRGLPLESLYLSGCAGVTELEPLRGLPLESLSLSGCAGVTELEPLRGLPLQHLNLSGCAGVTDLEPLRGLPLEYLSLSGCAGVTDLEPLRGLPLETLSLLGCAGVTELEPLRGLPLKYLYLLGSAGVTDLEPLRGLPLKYLSLIGCAGLSHEEVTGFRTAKPDCHVLR